MLSLKYIIRLTFGILLSIICNITPAYSQAKISYKRYTTSDGLPHNITYKVHQDSRGYLWVGTDDGLARFDGTDWKNYDIDDGLKSPFVIDIDEGEDGTIWIATWKGGLHRLKNDSIYPINVENGIDKINGIKIINDTCILIWNFGRLYQYTHSNAQWYGEQLRTPYLLKDGNYQLLRDNDVGQLDIAFYLKKNDVFPVSNGVIIHGIADTVYKYQNDTIAFPFFVPPIKDEIVTATYETQNNIFWYASKKRIHKVNESGKITLFENGLPNETIYSLNIVNGRYAFLITGTSRYANRKFYRYDLVSKECVFLNNYLRLETAPAHLYQDTEKNLWLSTDGDGLFCIYNSYFNYWNSSNGLKSEFIKEITGDNDSTVWVGTKSSLYKFPQGYPEKVQLTTNTPIDISDILFDKKGLKNWVIGTSISFYQLNGNDFEMELNISGKTGMLDAKGQLISLVARDKLRSNKAIEKLDSLLDDTYSILNVYDYLFNGDAYISKSYDGSGSKIFTIDSIQNLYLFDSEYRKHRVLEGLPVKNINIIYIDKHQNIWIGADNGLFHIVQTYQSQYELKAVYKESDGLVSNKCRTLLMDEYSTLWIGTPKGLMYFDGNSFRIHNTKTGLISNDVNTLHIDKNKKLWTGGSKGISILDYIYPLPKVEVPKLYLEVAEVNGKPTVFSQQEHVFETSASFSFSFKLISYLYPEKLVYQYKLNEGEWVDLKDNTLTFPSLKPNTYTLSVRGKKANSNWSETIDVNFEIRAPWWVSWWAILFYNVLLALCLWGIMQIQRKRFKKREEEKNRINKLFTQLELKALQAQMNPHFIFNSLNSIQGFILDNDELQANDYLSSFAQLMRMYLESSKSKYISISEEVRLLQLYIKLEGLRFGSKFNFSVNAENHLLEDDFKIPSMLVQPFVENSINHGLAYKKGDGTLSIEFKEVENAILCIVEDDGVGRKKALEIKSKMRKTHKSRAMQIVDERLSAINLIDGIEVTIEVIDKYDAQNNATGTRVEIRFPVIDIYIEN